MNKTFKLVNAADYYQYDQQYQIWKDKSDDQEYMKNLVQNGEDIQIVGIVQPKDDSSATMLSTGIYYPSSLIDHVIKNQLKVKSCNNKSIIIISMFLLEKLLI